MSMLLKSGYEISHIPDLSDRTEDQKKALKEWVEALRSGKYVQTHQALHTSEGFCCLGVFADVHRKKLNQHWSTFSYNQRGIGEATYINSLPLEYRKLGGLDDGYGFRVNVKGRTIKISLANLNDSFNATFPEIADIIEIAINGGY